MATTETALAWTDVETTGLTAHTDHLLEVAIVMTDLDLVELDPVGFQAKVLHTKEQADRMRAQAGPVVREMHDRTGLWDAITDPRQARPLEEVAARALAYVRRFAPAPRSARLAGSSCRLDLNFVDEHLPALAKHLHYRMLDVSSWVGPAQWWAGVEPMEKKLAHTAMADIRESINEMRFVRAALGLGQPRPLRTVKEVAYELGVSTHVVKAHIAAGRLPSVTLPDGKVRISPVDVARFVHGG